MSLHKN